MPSRLLTLALLFVVRAIAPTTALAQSAPVTLIGRTGLAHATGALGTRLSNGLDTGVSLEREFTPSLAGYFDAGLTLFLGNIIEGPSASSVGGAIGLRSMLRPRERVSPFMRGGVLIRNFSYARGGGASAASDVSAGGEVGAGLRFRIDATKALLVSLDYRTHAGRVAGVRGTVSYLSLTIATGYTFAPASTIPADTTR